MSVISEVNKLLGGGTPGSTPAARITPTLGLPIEADNPVRKIKVSKQEIEKFLKRRKIPITEKSRSRAKKIIQENKYRKSLPRSKDISFAQPDAAWQVAYGKVQMPGVITFINQSGANKQYLNYVVTFTAHEISSLEKIYVDGNLVTFAAHGTGWGVSATGGTKPDGTSIDYTNKVYAELNVGTLSQSALAGLVAELPTFWTSAHRQRGHSHAWIKFTYDATLFTGDEPEMTFEIKGKKVYDPRSGLTVWSNNAALCIGDFLTDTRYGLGYDIGEIDTASLGAAADICDQSVTVVGGGTEPRYTVNGWFKTDEATKDQVLADMEAAMGGFVNYTNGKWRFFPATYRTPILTLTEDDCRSELEIEIMQSERSVFNSVRGQYVSSENNYELSDYPAQSISAYVTADGGKIIWADIDYAFVTSSPTAQRLARIEMERSRRQIHVTGDWALKCLQLEPGDTVALTFSRYGWSSKVFEIADWDLKVDSNGAVVIGMELREHDSGFDDWTPGTDEQSIHLAPTTNLPDPRLVAALSGLACASGTTHLDVRNDGTVLTRIYVSWTVAPDVYVTQGGHVEIQYKKSADSNYTNLTPLPGDATFAYIIDAKDSVNYDVRARFMNALGVPGAYSTVSAHTVVGKTAAPSNVSGFSATAGDDGVTFAWTQISDLDKSKYEIRYGASWAAGTVLGRVDASGAQSLVYPFRTAGATTFRIKAIDTSGNYSTTDATAAVTIAGPNAARNFVVSVVDQSILLDWDTPTASTLTVNKYHVYKGDNLLTAFFLGTVFGTFHTYVETQGGTFTYHVVPEDVGGNTGSAVSQTATVTVPDDFYIQDSKALLTEADSTTSDLALFDTLPDYGAVVILPVEDETFGDWFDNNGWTTLQDAIDAGFDSWLTPGALDPGFLEFKVDFGVTFGDTFVDFNWTEVKLGTDTTEIVPTISVSADDVSYTDYAGSKQQFASGFRYVKFRLDFTAVSAASLSLLHTIVGRVYVKRDEEVIVVSAVAGDSGGTTALFTKDWLSVEDIQLTAQSTTPAIPVKDFTSVPNPVSFKVLVFDENGARISRTVTARVKGALNP